MAWRVSLGSVLIGASVFATQGSAGAQAAEAYLCGPDTVVYVEAGELEEKKRTDPCIAAYFGLKVEASAPAAQKTPAAAAPASATPAKRSDVFSELKASQISTEVRAKRNDVMAMLAKPVVAAPGTDYRNVRVINAQSEDGAWYRHAR